jgi:hypothetical protein
VAIVTLQDRSFDAADFKGITKHEEHACKALLCSFCNRPYAIVTTRGLAKIAAMAEYYGALPTLLKLLDAAFQQLPISRWNARRFLLRDAGDRNEVEESGALQAGSYPLDESVA